MPHCLSFQMTKNLVASHMPEFGIQDPAILARLSSSPSTSAPPESPPAAASISYKQAAVHTQEGSSSILQDMLAPYAAHDPTATLKKRQGSLHFAGNLGAMATCGPNLLITGTANEVFQFPAQASVRDFPSDGRSDGNILAVHDVSYNAEDYHEGRQMVRWTHALL
jgi:hypothetical protein